MKIITLIASHLDDKRRLHNFMKLIKTINDQIDYHDEIDVRISLSIGNIDKKEVELLLATINKLNFKIYYQETQMSQFEHYKYLCNSLEEFNEENTWILFSDDDDEWAQNRLAAYHYMISCLTDKPEDYSKTTSVCYTNEKNKSSSMYIGNYVDYCVKLKYLKIFFLGTSETQLKHKFCDCYFVKFICTYGLGKLKRAFCATEDILYHWKKTDTGQKIGFNEAIKNNLDLYIAQYTKPNAKDWLKFCFLYCEDKLDNKKITIDAKRYMIKLYLENYDNHIFADKYMPIYSDQ